MPRVLCAGLLIGFWSGGLAAARLGPPPEDEVDRFEPHGGTEAERARWNRVLEDAGAQIDELLAIRPRRPQPARVRIFDNAESWRRRLDQERQPRLPGWDRLWYGVDTDTIYLVRQPTEYETHEQLIFGATLQRFATRKGKNKDGWRSSYAIGLAIHLSHHRQVADGLELGVVPPITTTDYTAQALERFDPNATDAHVNLSEHSADWRVSFALTRFALLGSNQALRDRFLKLGLGRSGSKLDARGATQLFGEPRTLTPKVRAFLLAHEEPWRRRSGHFGPVGVAGFEGRAESGTIAFATLKSPPERLALVIEADAPAYGALIVGYVDDQHYEAFSRYGDRLEHCRQDDTGYAVLGAVEIHGPGRIALVRDRARLAVHVDGAPAFETRASAGSSGVAAYDGRVVFRDVTWE